MRRRQSSRFPLERAPPYRILSVATNVETPRRKMQIEEALSKMPQEGRVGVEIAWEPDVHARLMGWNDTLKFWKELHDAKPEGVNFVPLLDERDFALKLFSYALHNTIVAVQAELARLRPGQISDVNCRIGVVVNEYRRQNADKLDIPPMRKVLAMLEHLRDAHLPEGVISLNKLKFIHAALLGREADLIHERAVRQELSHIVTNVQCGDYLAYRKKIPMVALHDAIMPRMPDLAFEVEKRPEFARLIENSTRTARPILRELEAIAGGSVEARRGRRQR